MIWLTSRRPHGMRVDKKCVLGFSIGLCSFRESLAYFVSFLRLFLLDLRGFCGFWNLLADFRHAKLSSCALRRIRA